MSRRSTTDTILMIRPANFGYNAETADNNTFQSFDDSLSASEIHKKALEEFDRVVVEIRAHDIDVIVIEDSKSPVKTDAIFPNNWLSTHEGGILVTYPMWSKNRRQELREDIIELLKSEYHFNKRYGFEYLVDDEQYLEGTGSMVLDRANKVIFASLSPRTHIKALEKFAIIMGYRKYIFHSRHKDTLIYHTNVMMTVADRYVIICLESIIDEFERKELLDVFKALEKEVIEISLVQMEKFAANAIQLQSQMGEKYLILSDTAYHSFTAAQLDRILFYNKIIKLSIPIIEKYGGGGIRCMICELYSE